MLFFLCSEWLYLFAFTGNVSLCFFSSISPHRNMALRYAVYTLAALCGLTVLIVAAYFIVLLVNRNKSRPTSDDSVLLAADESHDLTSEDEER